MPKKEEKTVENPKSELKMARKGKVGQLSIVGPIGWDYFGVSYRGFLEMLESVKGVNTLEVEITSPGGIVVDGIAIHNALVDSEANVHVYINGIAASIASVIAMAGDKIFIPSNSTMMVHKPMVMSGGNADELRKDAEVLDKLEKGLIASYKRHFKGTEQEIEDLLRKETYLTAEELNEKFDNVVVMKQEFKAVASMEPIKAELGDLDFYINTLEGTDNNEEFTSEERSLFKKFMDFVRNNKAKQPTKEVEMPMTPEEKAEIVKDITTSVVEALKKEPKQEETAPAVEKKQEIAFEGDPNSKEDVEAHLEKIKAAQLVASVDWNDPKSVAAYHKAAFASTNTTVPSNTEVPAAVRGSENKELAIEEAKKRVAALRK